MVSKSPYDELLAETEAVDDPYADLLRETSDQPGAYDDLLKETVAIEDPLLAAPDIAPDPLGAPVESLEGFEDNFSVLPPAAPLYTEASPWGITQDPSASDESVQTIEETDLSRLIQENSEAGNLEGLHRIAEHYSDNLSEQDKYALGRAAMAIIKPNPLAAIRRLDPAASRSIDASMAAVSGDPGDLPPILNDMNNARDVFGKYFLPKHISGDRSLKGERKKIGYLSGAEREMDGRPIIIGGMMESHAKIPRFSDDFVGWGTGNIWGAAKALATIPLIPVSGSVAAYSDWEYASSSPEPSDDVKAMRKIQGDLESSHISSGLVAPQESRRPISDFINPLSDDRASVMDSMISLVSPTPGPINGEFPEFGKRMGVTQYLDYPSAKKIFGYKSPTSKEMIEGAGAVSRMAVRHNKHPFEIILAMERVGSGEMTDSEFDVFLASDSELAKEAISGYRNLGLPKDLSRSGVAQRAWQIADDFNDSKEASAHVAREMSRLGKEKIRKAIAEGKNLGMYRESDNQEILLDALEMEFLDRRTNGSITAQYLSLVKQMPPGIAIHMGHSIEGLGAMAVESVAYMDEMMGYQSLADAGYDLADAIDPGGIGRDQWHRDTLFSLLDWTAIGGVAKAAGPRLLAIETAASRNLARALEGLSRDPKPKATPKTPHEILGESGEAARAAEPPARAHGAGPEWEQKAAPEAPAEVVSDIPAEAVDGFVEAAHVIDDAFGRRPNVVEGVPELPDLQAMESMIKATSDAAEAGVTQNSLAVTKSPVINRWAETLQERLGVDGYQASYLMQTGRVNHLRRIHRAQGQGHKVVDSQGVEPLVAEEASLIPDNFEPTGQLTRAEAIRRRAQAKQATHPEEAAAELEIADAIEKKVNDADRLASRGRVLADIPSGNKRISEASLDRLRTLMEEDPRAALEELTRLSDDGFRLSLVEEGIAVSDGALDLEGITSSIRRNYRERSKGSVVGGETEAVLVDSLVDLFEGKFTGKQGKRLLNSETVLAERPSPKAPGESPVLDEARFTLEDIQLRKAIERSVDGVERLGPSGLDMPLDVRGEILANYRKLPTEVQMADLAVEGVRDPILYMLVDSTVGPWNPRVQMNNMLPFIEEAARIEASRIRVDSFGRRTTFGAVEAQEGISRALMESGLTEAQWHLEVNKWQSAEGLVDAGWTHPDAYQALGFAGSRVAEFVRRAEVNPAQGAVKFKPSGNSRRVFASEVPEGPVMGEPKGKPTYWNPDGRPTRRRFADLFFGKRVQKMREQIMAPLEGKGAPKIGEGGHPSERPHVTEPFLEWLEHPFAFIQLPGWIGDVAMDRVYRTTGDSLAHGKSAAWYDRALAQIVGPRNRLGPIYQDIQSWRVRQRHRAGIAADVLEPLKGSADDVITIGTEEVRTVLEEAGVAFTKDPRTGRLPNDGAIVARNLESQRLLSALAEFDKTFVIKDRNGLKSTLGDWVASEVQTNGAWVTLDEFIARVDRGDISVLDAHLSVTDTRFVPRKGLSWGELPTEARNAVVLGNRFLRPFGAYLWDRTAQTLTGALSTKVYTDVNGAVRSTPLFSEAVVRKNMGRWLSEYYNDKMLADYWLGVWRRREANPNSRVLELALDQADHLLGKAVGGPKAGRLSDMIDSPTKIAEAIEASPTVSRFYRERLMSSFEHSFKKGEVLDMKALSEMSEAYGISPQLILQRNRGDFALPTLQEFAGGATFKFSGESPAFKIPTSLERRMEMGLVDFSDRLVRTVHGVEQNLANLTLGKTLREHGMILTESELLSLPKGEKQMFGVLSSESNVKDFGSVFELKESAPAKTASVDRPLYIHKRASEYFKDVKVAHEAATSALAEVSTTLKLALIANPLGTIPRNIITNVTGLGVIAPIPMRSTRVRQFYDMWRAEKTGKISKDMQAMRDAGFGASDVALNEFEALLQEQYMAYELEVLDSVGKSVANKMREGSSSLERSKAYAEIYGIVTDDASPNLAALADQLRTSKTARARSHESVASRAASSPVRDRMSAASRKAKSARRTTARIYGATDTVQRGGYVLELVYDHGMSWREAVATANRYLTDYMDVAPVFDSMSRNPLLLGAPFVRWTATSSQIWAEALHMRPLRFWGLNSAMNAHNQVVAEILGYSEDYVKAVNYSERGMMMPRIATDIADVSMPSGALTSKGGAEGAFEKKTYSSFLEGPMVFDATALDLSGLGSAFRQSRGLGGLTPEEIAGYGVGSGEVAQRILSLFAPQGGVLMPFFNAVVGGEMRNQHFYDPADSHSSWKKTAAFALNSIPVLKHGGDLAHLAGAPALGITPARGETATVSGALGLSTRVHNQLQMALRSDARFKKSLQEISSGINKQLASLVFDAFESGNQITVDEIDKLLETMSAFDRYKRLEKSRGAQTKKAVQQYLRWIRPRLIDQLTKHGLAEEGLLTGEAKESLGKYLDPEEDAEDPTPDWGNE